MNHPFWFLSAGLIICLSGCDGERISPQVVDLFVDYTWQGLKPCGWNNPEIRINGVPDNTKALSISMYDHVYSHVHGIMKMPYAGEKILAKDRFKKIQGPCPMYTPGRYEITIKALDGSGTVVAMGSKERRFPEE